MANIRVGPLIGSRKFIPRKAKPCKAPCLSEHFDPFAWKNKRCFILGGGPSLSGFNYNQLDNELTIGTNKTFTAYHANINYSMDYPFYEKVSGIQTDSESRELQEAWKQYNGLKVFWRENKAFRFDPGVHYIMHTQKKAISFDLSAGIYTGSNSGFGALMIAIALGATKIGLLGFDLKKDGEKTHWHKGYNGQDKKHLTKKLDTFKTCFNNFAPSIKHYGIDVANLNPDSALLCFRKTTFSEFLEEDHG